MKVTCNVCNNEMKVDDGLRGKKGKCPKCKSIFMVPDYTEDELIFDDNSLFGKFPLTRLFYETMMKKYSKRIESVRISTVEDESGLEHDCLIFIIKTGDKNKRSQNISLNTLYVDDNPTGEMCISSKICDSGIIDDEVYPTLLRVVTDPRISLSIDTDSILQIQSVAPFTEKSVESLSEAVISLAEVADNLEDKLSCSDDY
jgi:hypothetical protein